MPIVLTIDMRCSESKQVQGHIGMPHPTNRHKKKKKKKKNLLGLFCHNTVVFIKYDILVVEETLIKTL